MKRSKWDSDLINSQAEEIERLRVALQTILDAWQVSPEALQDALMLVSSASTMTGTNEK